MANEMSSRTLSIWRATTHRPTRVPGGRFVTGAGPLVPTCLSLHGPSLFSAAETKQLIYCCASEEEDTMKRNSVAVLSVSTVLALMAAPIVEAGQQTQSASEKSYRQARKVIDA